MSIWILYNKQIPADSHLHSLCSLSNILDRLFTSLFTCNEFCRSCEISCLTTWVLNIKMSTQHSPISRFNFCDLELLTLGSAFRGGVLLEHYYWMTLKHILRTLFIDQCFIESMSLPVLVRLYIDGLLLTSCSVCKIACNI